MDISVVEFPFQVQGKVFLLVTQVRLIADQDIPHTAQLRRSATDGEGKARALGVADFQFLADMEELPLAKGTVIRLSRRMV